MATEAQNIMDAYKAYSSQLDAEEAEKIDSSKGLSFLNQMTAGLGMYSAAQNLTGFAADAMDLRHPTLKAVEKTYQAKDQMYNMVEGLGLNASGSMWDMPEQYTGMREHVLEHGWGSESMDLWSQSEANKATNVYAAGTKLTGYSPDGKQHYFSGGLDKDYLFGGKYLEQWGTPGWAKGKDHDTLVNKVMGVESSGDSTAVSNVGAHGLMQVMPLTAIDPGIAGTDSIFVYAKKHGDNTDYSKLNSEQKKDAAKKLLLNPAINKDFGSDYLGSLIKRYSKKGKKRSIEHALVGYNAGMGVADDWDGKRESLKYGGGFMKVIYNDDGSVNMTRTEETYNYLNKILG